MQRFKKLLVVCQQDNRPDAAIERARVLAHANDAEITLIDIVDFDHKDMAEMLDQLPDRNCGEMQQQIFDYHRSALEARARALSDEGLRVRAEVLDGVPFIEIIRAVQQDGHDLVLKGSGDAASDRRTMFLGLDMHLMRKCPCPVMIVNEPFGAEQATVLAAIDPAPEAGASDDANRLILDLATSLCAASGAHLHVVHAWRIEEEQTLLISSLIRATPEELKKIKQRKRARRAGELHQLLSRYPQGHENRDVHILQGHAGEVVPKLAERLRVDMVVMGTVSRTDVTGMYIGSTAETIIARLGCSVLAVKPRGFRTPVELNETPAAKIAELHTHLRAA